MQADRNLLLIDSNSRRRAAACHQLANSGIHAEPFEDLAEIKRRWPRQGIILAEDDHGNIAGLVEHMTEAGSWLPVIAFRERPMVGRVVQAVMAGAVDYLEWPATPADIIAALDEVDTNAARIGSVRLREARARSRVQKLTRREREVLAGVATGLSNRLIGEQLAISPRTVEIHRANMLNKMGASHTSEAIRIAIEASLVA
jgi:FixJ family two-component response regulator